MTLSAFALGGLYSLGFAPYNLPYLTLAALGGFFVLLLRGAPVRVGYAFGFGLFLAGAYWFYISFHHFGDAVEAVAALVTLVFLALLALVFALLAWVYQRLRQSVQPRSALSHVALLASLWMIFEALRLWLFGGFPWLSLGYALIDTPFVNLVRYGGVHSLSAIGAVMAANLAYLLLQPNRRSLLLALVGYTVLGLVVMQLPNPVQTTEKTLKVAAVQPNIAQHQKLLESQLQPSIDLLKSQTAPLAGQVDVVLWPESAVPSFIELTHEQLLGFAAETRIAGTDVVTGLFTVDYDTREVYNTLVNLNNLDEYYRKHRLVPFGETIPLRRWLAPLAIRFNIPLGDLFPSDEPLAPFQVGDHSVGAFICYEAAYGHELTEIVDQIDYWLTVSNDAWFGDTSAPHQHLQITRMRAIETGKPIVRSSNTGISAIIDHNGDVTAELGVNQLGVVTGEIALTTGQTLYSKLGNWPIWVLSWGALFVLLAPRKWPRISK